MMTNICLLVSVVALVILIPLQEYLKTKRDNNVWVAMRAITDYELQLNASLHCDYTISNDTATETHLALLNASSKTLNEIVGRNNKLGYFPMTTFSYRYKKGFSLSYDKTLETMVNEYNEARGMTHDWKNVKKHTKKVDK